MTEKLNWVNWANEQWPKKHFPEIQRDLSDIMRKPDEAKDYVKDLKESLWWDTEIKQEYENYILTKWLQNLNDPKTIPTLKTYAIFYQWMTVEQVWWMNEWDYE